MDGTDNNKDRDTPLGSHTNVARLYEYDTAHGTNLSLNSGAAPRKYGPGGLTGQSEKINKIWINTDHEAVLLTPRGKRPTCKFVKMPKIWLK